MPEDGSEEVTTPSSPRPLTTPAWAAPAGQRSLLRASQRPALETLPEQHSPMSSSLPPIGGGKNFRKNYILECRWRCVGKQASELIVGLVKVKG